MPGPSPAARPRTGGGFNPGMGSGAFSEHLDENAMQAAMGQKQLSQQQADPSTASAAAQAAQQKGLQGLTQAPSKQKPREVGTIPQELVARPAKDIVKGVLSLFDINSLLGVDPVSDSPQEIAKKRQIHQRWTKLNQEQQQVAQQRYQELMQKKQQQEQEEQIRKEQEAQAEQQAVMPTSGPKKGPAGPAGSKKQKASQQLEMQRKSMGGGAKPKN